MRPDQQRLVTETWEKVLPIRSQAATLFYTRLFEQYPEVKPYFKGNMKQQGKKLMTMIDTAVNGLGQLPSLVEPIKQMGARHVDYGVKDEDYDKVGTALLWMLGQCLGSSFTPEAKKAWADTYAMIADVMKTGANEVTAAEPCSE